MAVLVIFLMVNGLFFTGLLGMLGAFVILSVWIAAWAMLHERRWRRTVRQVLNERGMAKLCIDCGYDLRMHAGDRCPECGATSAKAASS